MDVDVVVGGASLGEQAAVERVFRDWEGVFSRFRPGSELNHVNASEASTVAASPLFAHVLRMALTAAASTDGLVDPTLGAAIVASGYDRDFAQLGADARPAGAAAPGRWRAVRLSGQLVSRPPGVHIDLNGFVKAHAVDRALSFLAGDGFVAAGGDVAVRGSAFVGLPGEGSVRLGGGGVATSGTHSQALASRRRAQAPSHRPADRPARPLPLDGGDRRRADVSRRGRGRQGGLPAFR
jgi:thiamine biosynthesis lipoprotein ApbE